MANFIIVPAIRIVKNFMSLFNTFLLVVKIKYKFVIDKYIIFSRFIHTAEKIKRNVQHGRHIETIKIAESSK